MCVYVYARVDVFVRVIGTDWEIRRKVKGKWREEEKGTE